MVEEKPKDYSSVYREERVKSDGVRSYKRANESAVDLLAVVAKLQNLPQKNHTSYAMDTLNRHYSTVFRKKTDFKVYIKYHEDKETFVFRVERNFLEDVVARMPKKGDFRYFFKQPDLTCEEVESFDVELPYFEKDGTKIISCQVFKM